MITYWKLANFKSVQTPTGLPIAPLTILAGANSTGKSTLLQSILTIAQTLARKASVNPIALNGALVRLGQFPDVRCADSTADRILMAWNCEPLTPSGITNDSPRSPDSSLHSVSCELQFDTDPHASDGDATQTQPRLLSTTLTATLRVPELHAKKCSITIRRQIDQLAQIDPDKPRSRLPSDTAPRLHHLREHTDNYDVVLDDDSLAELRREYPSAELVGCTVRHFLPHALSVRIDLHLEEARAVHTTLTGGFHRRGHLRSRTIPMLLPIPDKVVDFVLKTLHDIAGPVVAERARGQVYKPRKTPHSHVSLDALTKALRRLSSSVRNQLRSTLAGSSRFERLVHRSMSPAYELPFDLSYPLSAGLAAASRYLDDFFATSIRYLGPLRDEPKPAYPLLTTSDVTDIGLRGEHTAAVLDLHRNTVIKYVPSHAFEHHEITRVLATRPLGEAVADWLHYLGVADAVQSHNMGKFGHQLTVDIPYTAKPHDLTHVGVGVSQALPIVVASLLADSDTTLIFEQPELHLHPSVQTRLADFFLSMTRLGKQCIVETHSEYIVNRLRLRTATSSESLEPILKIYFVERDQRGTTFREVAVNEYGAIPEWPRGFFDQGPREAESILRAGALRRKSRHDKEQAQ